MNLTLFYKGMLPHHISQGFHSGHKGLDVVFGYGTPLCAPENVLILKIYSDEKISTSTDGIKYGYGVEMKGLETGHEYIYWHCLPFFPVWGGDAVKRGGIVAFMGNAGYVTVNGRAVTVEERDHLENGNFKEEALGTHLHIQMSKDGEEIDPRPFINFNWQPQYTKWDLIKAITTCLSKMARAIN